MTRIGHASHVTLHYRMALVVDGVEQELVNTFCAAPATLQMGVGQWASTIEERLLGLHEGSASEFELPAEQAYGVHNPDLVRLLSRAQIEEQCEPGSTLAVGETVQLRAGELPLLGVLTRYDAGGAMVDFNHPLAGLPMRVRVQVIGVL